MLSGGQDATLIDTSDFFEIGGVDSGATKGNVRFSGFDIEKSAESGSGDNEDTDIVAVRTRGSSGDSMKVFTVDDSSRIGSSPVYTYTPGDGLQYFNPDCVQIGNEKYITFAALTPGVLLIRLFRYVSTSKTCSQQRLYRISGIPGDIGIKDVFACRSPQNSIEKLQFLITSDSGKAYSIDADALPITNFLSFTPWTDGSMLP